MKKIFLLFIALTFILKPIETVSQPQPKSQPYVLLISFDGFRWDYLDRGITPNLDKFINKGVRAISFRPAFPSKTFPNHLSIITGMYPENHGIILNKFENPHTGEVYKLSDRKEVANPKWYLGEPFWVTADRSGIKTASFFWPASSMKDHHPDIFKKYDGKVNYESRVDTIASWLQKPAKQRPHFYTLYYSLTDTYGHEYGPESDEVNYAIARLDTVTGYLINRLKQINMFDSLNIIIVSDHGMTDISPDRIINVEKILRGKEVKYQSSGPVMMISPFNDSVDNIYKILKSNENHYKVYKKSEVPDYYFFDKNPFISDLVLVADLGWSLVNNHSIKSYIGTNAMKGNHGYDKDALDMHGIFLAEGPAFKQNFKTGTIWNIDIYPLLCKIFGIAPRSNIDGKISRIDFILK
jgi:ectonucleotide pyrophosphatase/phosphodiesterase family protein 5